VPGGEPGHVQAGFGDDRGASAGLMPGISANLAAGSTAASGLRAACGPVSPVGPASQDSGIAASGTGAWPGRV